jgi:hypothetical protein
MESVHAVAKRLDDELSAYEFKWDQAVEVNDEEGTKFFFVNAFCLEYNDWLMVFTEHQRFHVFHQDELTSWQAWTRTDTESYKKFKEKRDASKEESRKKE